MTRPHALDAHAFDALKWRCIGPPRGGRVVAVAGDPVDPATFYFGACAGGIWKTIDAGIYWRCVSDGFLDTAAIGAIAVASSDHNVIYAGTGETEIRLDVSYGDGVYKSEDAGRTWKHVGLRESKFIGCVRIHPTNPDIVYVAALGDVFGPNEERGVFRSLDGGKSWQKVLYRSAKAGAVDLSMDLNNPRILFAGFWEVTRNFWNISSGGPGSSLYRSVDGGDTWEEISRSSGLPDTMLGKIGVAASPARAGRVWALIEAAGGETGLYRSDDYGALWTKVSAKSELMVRPWYFTHVFADTRDPDTVYVLNNKMWKSSDAGANFQKLATPHGDNHDLWIDPLSPNRMVQGNDGGCCVSLNGGMTWSSIYNQPTAQFYRIDTDNRHPYRVYGTQQDSTSIAVPSASYNGAITLGDCSYPGTAESGFVAVNPDNNDVVYCGAVGSSPGGAGGLQRYDYKTGQIQLVNVWPEQSDGIAPKHMKYRFAWTFPIVFSPHDSKVLYAAGNIVWRTTDEGMSWLAISPDLSLNDPSRQGVSGGEITREDAGAEVHATCASLVESPHRKGEIWASTDDGLVHATRDGGKVWENVTPPAMPKLAYVGCVEVSTHDADTVYVSATRYKLADYKPYLFRTTDGGKHWESITGDFPQGEITRVIRADTVRKGLLFVGTETGVFFTQDDGRNWRRLPGGLPIVPVYDLKIKAADLIAGTHGRSFWVLDDISPLRALGIDIAGTQLVTPRTTVRSKLNYWAFSNLSAPVSFELFFGIGGGIATVEKPDGTLLEHLDVGENPPFGVIVYYWLDKNTDGPVTLTFRDSHRTEIVSLRSDDKSLPAASRPTVKSGLNRYVWDMKWPGAAKPDPLSAGPRTKTLAAEPDAQTGPTVVPSDYWVELTSGSMADAKPFSIVKDPRLPTTQKEYEHQFELLKELHDRLGSLNLEVKRIRGLQPQLRALADRAERRHFDLAAKASAILDALAAIEGMMVGDLAGQTPGFNAALSGIIYTIANADMAPTTQAESVAREIMAQFDAKVAELEATMAHEIAELNRLAAERATDHLSFSRGGE